MTNQTSAEPFQTLFLKQQSEVRSWLTDIVQGGEAKGRASPGTAEPSRALQLRFTV